MLFWQWIQSNEMVLLGGVLVLFNEWLASNPSVASNSVIQFIVNILKSAVGMGPTPPPAA